MDEAGRGSVLGPLVVAGVTIDERDTHQLRELGVKDSKLLTPTARKKLYREIKRIARSVVWERIDPYRIDQVVFKGTRLQRLNSLEAKYMARVLGRLGKFDLAYVDCCDTVQKRYGELVADLLLDRVREKDNSFVHLGEVNHFRSKLISEHHADSNYPVVSAASIIAKVRRDDYIARLHKMHGVFGSGYPSDPTTKKFLEGFVKRSEDLPSFTRLSWSTVRNLYGKIEGRKDSSIDQFPSKLH